MSTETTLLLVVAILTQASCTPNSTFVGVPEEAAAAVISSDPTVPTPTQGSPDVTVGAERRTDSFYDGLEPTNSEYNPPPSSQSYSPTGLAHQDQINYVSQLFRQYNPGGAGFVDPYGNYFDYAPRPEQRPRPQGSVVVQPQQDSSGPRSFGQDYPFYEQLPVYSGNPNFRPRSPIPQAQGSSDVAPTSATTLNSNPDTTNGYYAPPIPPAPTFPAFTFPSYSNVNSSTDYGLPPDYDTYGSYDRIPQYQFNPYLFGNPPGGPPPRQGFNYPQTFRGFTHFPQQPNPQSVPQSQALPTPIPLQPQSQPYPPNSNAQPTIVTQIQPGEGSVPPTRTSNQDTSPSLSTTQSNTSNRGQFEDYYPNYPYGLQDTLPGGFQPLRPGSEYGYDYSAPVFPNAAGSNGSSSNPEQTRGFTEYSEQRRPTGSPNEPTPGSYYVQRPPYQLQGSEDYFEANEPAPRPSARGSVTPDFPPPRATPLEPQPVLLPSPPPIPSSSPHLARFQEFRPPRLPDSYGNQLPPGSQGRAAPFRELRRRPLGPNFFAYVGSSSQSATPEIEEATTPASASSQVKVKRRGQVLALRGGRPNCSKTTNVTFCLEDSNYPRDKIKRALETSPSSLDLLYKEVHQSTGSQEVASSAVFGARIPPSEDMKRRRGQETSRSLSLDSEKKRYNDLSAPCPSSVHYARPLRALSAQGEWKIIVNMQEHKFRNRKVAEQVVRLDICSHSSMPCSYSGASSESSSSRCLQKRKLHRLLAWTETEGLHQENFYLPVACSCFVSN